MRRALPHCRRFGDRCDDWAFADQEIRPQLTIPQVTMPVFTWQAMLGLALPLFVLANASQNAPGIGVLRSFGYDTPVNGPVGFTGLISLLTALIGSHGVALSAITAAICVSPDAHPDKDKRYSAGVAYGFWYILFGLFGATVVALFTGLPKPLVATLAGLSLDRRHQHCHDQRHVQARRA